VRLCCKINYCVGSFCKGLKHRSRVSDIAFDESVPILIQAAEIVQVSRVSKRIEVYYLAVREFREQESHERRSNESGSPGNKEFTHRQVAELPLSI
jgi:hypothetical protein